MHNSKMSLVKVAKEVNVQHFRETLHILYNWIVKKLDMKTVAFRRNHEGRYVLSKIKAEQKV